MAQVGPPELDREWSTDKAYGRDELRRIIEDLGVHPIDVADAFDQADRTTLTQRGEVVGDSLMASAHPTGHSLMKHT